jgi:hypothetical protein
MQEEGGSGKQHRHRAVRLAERLDAVGTQMIEMVGAPGAEGHGGLGRTARTELIGVDAQGQPNTRGRRGDGRKIVQRERDVLHVDVDLIDERLVRRRGDQLVARCAHPVAPRDAVRHGVTGEQGHGACLRRCVGESARQPRLAELGRHREPVAGLELHRGRAVCRHLAREREAERQHLVVGSGREHPAAAEDPTLLAVEIAVARAGQARLELVGPPADERQMDVAVDEPGNERSTVLRADRRWPR